MRFRLVFLLAVALVFVGCSTKVKQTVTPFKHTNVSKICMIDNPKVKESFRDAYQRALEAKGYTVEIIDKGSQSNACEVTTRYTATWGWDLALYLSYAQLKVYKNGKDSGEAVYKVVFGGTTGKFIDAEEKVIELVNQLFPG